MVKDLDYAVVVTYECMDHGTEVKRVLLLEDDSTLTEMRDLMKDELKDQDFETLEAIKDVEELMEAYEQYCNSHCLDERYYFTLKLIG